MKKITLKYYNPVLKIAMGKWNQVYFIPEEENNPIELKPEYYKGSLVFRLPGSNKRISYKCIKANLKYKTITLFTEEFKLPF